jgi:5-methylcytosine-specific restriction endonuclease McrA
LFLLAEGHATVHPLMHLLVDLRTDLPRRLRRRAAHRRRRKARKRYRALRRYGRPFKTRRPSRARSARRRATRQAKKRTHATAHRAVPPTIVWRAQAIERVIAALRPLIPISHVILRSSLPASPQQNAPFNRRERRQQLIAAYGKQGADGRRIAVCAYCGTTEGTIEVEHVVPRSRGGTDAWHNTVLACKRCNAAKGDRTPADAGLSLRPPFAAHHAQQATPWASFAERQTASVLQHKLAGRGMRVMWQHAQTACADLSAKLWAELEAFLEKPTAKGAGFIARPIARPRKQVFTGRNYPLDTPLNAAYTRVGQTVKRRVRVNAGLIRWQERKRMRVQVVKADEHVPRQAGQVVKAGMLCEARYQGKSVIGIVQAIHSSGRLTLLVPQHASVAGVVWKRVVVGTRRHLRIVSSDRVVFLRNPLPCRNHE